MQTGSFDRDELEEIESEMSQKTRLWRGIQTFEERLETWENTSFEHLDVVAMEEEVVRYDALSVTYSKKRRGALALWFARMYDFYFVLRDHSKNKLRSSDNLPHYNSTVAVALGYRGQSAVLLRYGLWSCRDSFEKNVLPLDMYTHGSTHL